MRVVGGRWSGRRFEAPEGRGTTRPTTERTREAIASMILSEEGLDLTGSRVLDAFAGSGAMGIELLSRGAAQATFVDRDRRACALIRRNLASLAGEGGPWRVVCGDAQRLVARRLAGGPFDVVFLDPPYALGAAEVARMVEAGVASGTIAPGALVVYERPAEGEPAPVAGARTVRSRSRGISCVDLMRVGEDHD